MAQERSRKCLLLALSFALTGLLVRPVIAAQAAPEANPKEAPVQPGEHGTEDQDWADTGHDYVADGANRLVQWMDDFYGTDIEDFESANSKIRVRFGYGYDELEEGDFKVRVRAKVQLPKMSKRVALVVEGEEGDDFNSVGPNSDDDENQVGLQYKFGEFGRNRFDGILSVNSSANLRAGVRFRHDGRYSDTLTGRFSQAVAYQTGDKGAFTRTSADGFYRIDDDDLLAWINRVEYGEDTYGVEWRSSLQWRHRLDEHSAFSYMVGLDGVTDPDPLTENYGFAVNYRTNIFRKYLFVEVEPAYMWRKEADFDSRVGVYAVTVRLEIHFEKKPGKRKAKVEEPVVGDPAAGEPLAWSRANSADYTRRQ